MRKYHEYDNRNRRNHMKAKRIRQVFERRNNVTRYGIYRVMELEEIADEYWDKCNFEKCKQTMEQLKNIEATMGYKHKVERLEKVIIFLEGKG